MRLEVGTFPVKEMLFGSQTHWNDGVLEVNRDEILSLVLEGSPIKRAELEIARPGESVRVMNYTDVVEPKVKVEGQGKVYPGVCGRPTQKVGQGRTHRLGNCAVVESLDYTGMTNEERYGRRRRESSGLGPFFDMSGINAVTPYASLFNLCLAMEAPRGMDTGERYQVLHSATMRVTDRLAEAVAEQEPPELETFDLTPRDGLPGAVYVLHEQSQEWMNGARSPLGIAVYGQTRLSAPWLLDGTEILDGVISQGGNQGHTWLVANSPVVLEMCRRHGTTFNFRGCIIQRTNWSMQVEKEMVAERAAHLARQVGAQAAIVTTDARGQRWVETVLTVQAFERAGIKTVLLSEEEDNEGGTALPFLVSPPELVSVVSTGTAAVPNTFPPVKKVVGAVNEVDDRWYQELPPIPGRYGASHAQDQYGYGKQSVADF